ncbi:hypothetical protein AVEN_136409-1 [Araneus ventricosus]|uniref:Uncharacterized protein n=1 Tax=Araneus ventricosus TaxID=182803 RepID=A0A4Y2NB63_ARAVE|nr:hypothetical protein AVEN_136409-1 [Araneus ventricosus]
MDVHLPSDSRATHSVARGNREEGVGCNLLHFAVGRFCVTALLEEGPCINCCLLSLSLCWGQKNKRFRELLGLWNDPARPSVCSTDQLFHAADDVSWLLSFPNRSIYLLLTMPASYGKEMERLRKLLAEVETDEDSDFDNEDK